MTDIIDRLHDLKIRVFSKFNRNTTNFILFLFTGLPSFLIALPLNFYLVEYFNWPKPIAYALVLIVQVSINFFMCRLFVFENVAKTSLAVQYLQFMSGILAFRFFDWALYSLFTHMLPIHFTIIQIGNVVIFSLLKYRFAKRVIEGR